MPELLTASTADAIRALIAGEPPRVTALGVDSRDERPHGVHAALLVWGKHAAARRWAAGICWPFQKCRGSAITALLTLWLPAEQIQAHPRESYDRVAVVALDGPVEDWPTLPGVYPRIGDDWQKYHLHATRPDPEGEYHELREAMRALRRNQ